MNKSRSLHALEQFLGSYFHQDWTCEADSADEVLLRFKADNPSEIVDEIVRDIDQLLAAHVSEGRLAKRLEEFGFYYDPGYEGRDHRQWLAHARALLT